MQMQVLCLFLLPTNPPMHIHRNNRLWLQPPWIRMSSFYIQPTISSVQALPPWSMWSPSIRFASKTLLARCNVWIIHVRYSPHCHNVISAHFNYGSAVSERIRQRMTRNYLRAHWLRLSRIRSPPSSSTSCSIVVILFSHACMSECVRYLRLWNRASLLTNVVWCLCRGCPLKPW